MNKNSKGFAQIFVLIILALIVVGGIGYYAYKNEQVRLTPQQSVSPDPTVAEVANWKTYLNTEYNYEVKYPPTWKATEENGINQDYLFITPPNWILGKLSDGNITIRVEKYGENIKSNDQAFVKFQDFMKSCSSQTPTSCTEKNSDDYRFEKEIQIAGRLAFQTYGGCCLDVGRQIFMYEGVNEYRFTLYNFDSNTTNLENEDIFDQILSTFKFIDQVQEVPCSQSGLCPQPMCIPGEKDCPPSTTCSYGKCLPTSEVTETDSTTACEINKECWCKNFDGARFLSGKVEGICNLKTHRCNNCYYE